MQALAEVNISPQIRKDNEVIHSAIRHQLELKRSKYRLISIEYLCEVQNEIEGKGRRGKIKGNLYQDYLKDFQFNTAEFFPNARSIFIVAIPEPQMGVVLEWQPKPIRVIIPPTYIDHKKVANKIGKIINSILNPFGYCCSQTFIPLKLLATHSGLAKYGKNNITYVDGMGSFLGLAAYYSDLPVLDAGWKASEMMPACQNCQVCQKACPTGAIDPTRFLIHAEKCLTFFNENPPKFPAWLQPEWHNCLLGCMRCQLACPQNRPVKDWIKVKAAFTHNEVAQLLETKNADEIAPSLLEKIEANELGQYFNVLGRNINALLFDKDLK